MLSSRRVDASALPLTLFLFFPPNPYNYNYDYDYDYPPKNNSGLCCVYVNECTYSTALLCNLEIYSCSVAVERNMDVSRAAH